MDGLVYKEHRSVVLIISKVHPDKSLQCIGPRPQKNLYLLESSPLRGQLWLELPTSNFLQRGSENPQIVAFKSSTISPNENFLAIFCLVSCCNRCRLFKIHNGVWSNNSHILLLTSIQAQQQTVLCCECIKQQTLQRGLHTLLFLNQTNVLFWRSIPSSGYYTNCGNIPNAQI